MQLEVLSTARDASVAGMERKDEVGHATSAAGAQRDCTHQSEGSHPPAQETWPLPPDAPVLCASRRHFGGFLSQPTFVGYLHLAVVPTSTRSGACGLRPHVFMPERRTAAAPCRAAGEGPRRTEQADEKSSIHFALARALVWTFHESHVTSSDDAFLIQNQTPWVC